MQWLLHALSMAALGGVIGYQLYVEHVRIDVNERELLMNHARMIAKNLSVELEATYQALLGVRADSAYWMQAGGGDRASNRLKTLADAMPGVRTITVLNREGTIVTSNRTELVGQNFARRPYFETARRLADPDAVIVSPPFTTSLGIYTMNLAMMIPGADRQFSGIVSATLEPEYFTTVLGSALYAPDMWSAIVHGDGVQFLTVPERPDQRGKNLALPGTFFTRHRQSGQTETLFKGTVYATGQYRMLAQITIRPPTVPMNSPLVAAISRDVAAAYADWEQDAMNQTALYCLLLLVSTVGLFFFQRRQRIFDRAVTEARLQAERASEAKSHFLANMGHEIRTPLNSIIGFSQLIRDRAYGPLDTEYVEAADDIHVSGMNLLTLVNDILNISKIEAGKMDIERARLPVGAILVDTIRVFRLKAETGKLTVSSEVENGELSVWADERALRHILFNLLSNAIKFTPEGGSISIKAVQAPDGGVLLSVSDTGVGIPASELSRVLQPFEQIDNRYDRAHGGTGLGLPLVQGLVALHGGRLEIDSEPGKGSRFTVWFPSLSSLTG
ncbi:MAG: ATP-binding protein [Rhodospirillaceae bacterium]